MPQANPNRPTLSGINSTRARSNAGNAAASAKSETAPVRCSPRPPADQTAGAHRIFIDPSQPFPSVDNVEHDTPRQKEEGTTMTKFGFAAVVASGLVAAILGLAAPAQAATAGNTPTVVASAIDIFPTDFGHHAWVVDIQPHANVPHR
jgi:hypothetical protein